MFAIGVCDKYLSVFVGAHHLYYLLNTLSVKFVKDVIEKQQWSGGIDGITEEIELGKFQGYHISLVLALASFTFLRIAAIKHFKIISVYAMK